MPSYRGGRLIKTKDVNLKWIDTLPNYLTCDAKIRFNYE